MKFKEAKLENAGCEEGDGSSFLYRNTAKFKGKGECSHLRCCIFCDQQDCKIRCDLAKAYPNQPKRIQIEFNCPRLRPFDELAWKYLLGTNVPKLG